MRWVACLVCWAGLTACSSDALYTYCDERSQCGSRSHYEGEDRIVVPNECIEASVELGGGHATRGNFCTLACVSDGDRVSDEDCASRDAVPEGACLRLAGDDDAFCYQHCEADSDCYPSSRCEGLREAGRTLAVCVPTRVR